MYTWPIVLKKYRTFRATFHAQMHRSNVWMPSVGVTMSSLFTYISKSPKTEGFVLGDIFTSSMELKISTFVWGTTDILVLMSCCIRDLAVQYLDGGWWLLPLFTPVGGYLPQLPVSYSILFQKWFNPSPGHNSLTLYYTV